MNKFEQQFKQFEKNSQQRISKRQQKKYAQKTGVQPMMTKILEYYRASYDALDWN